MTASPRLFVAILAVVALEAFLVALLVTVL